MSFALSRRSFIGAAALSPIALVASSPALAVEPTSPSPYAWGRGASQNGWPLSPALDDSLVEGSTQRVPLSEGDAGEILRYIARRFNYEIDTLRDGDLTGHTADPMISADFESNYLSGTALAIRPHQHPLGAAETFYPREQKVIDDILQELEGVVVWGGHLDPVKESHFQISLAPDDPRIAVLAQKLRDKSDPAREDGIGDLTLPEDA